MAKSSTLTGSRNAHRASKRPKTRRKSTAPPTRIRYAVLGLGHIVQTAVLPAFAQTKNDCELVALISDDEEKLKKLGKAYGVKRMYSHADFDRCLSDGVDAVYIALPNSFHYDFSLRALRAGVHVLCEKPMAVTVEEAQEIADAARASEAKFMVAYRLHFERANLRAIALANDKRLGELRFFTSTFSMQVKPGDIRVKAALGGGPLYDLGIYCINAARYLFRAEPTEVVAMSTTGHDERFTEVDEMTSVLMRFPNDRLASFTASFGAADVAAYELVGTRGRLTVDPAYEYSKKLHHCLTVDGKTRTTTFPLGDQFAAELSYFAGCISADTQPEPSAHEGLADLRVIAAIIQSIKDGRPVTVQADTQGVRRPDPDQHISRPVSRKKPMLVHVSTPTRDD